MSVIDDYLAKNATPTQRKELERIRTLSLKLVPGAEEVISYGIPTLKYKGTYVIYFAAFKDHMSVFPGGEITAALKERLEGYELHKGTVQFTEDKVLPDEVIEFIVKSRLQTIEQK